jgi:two-component system, chemotaxis family, CheB/CheR fusion protein
MATPTKRSRKPGKAPAAAKAAAARADRGEAARLADGAAFPIVGIGSSAGGIEALGALLDPMPTDIDMAFVVVQHLSPHRESFLPGVLSAATRLPVSHAEKDTKIEPGHVYVVPPDRFIELSDGHLRLTRRPHDRRQFSPINHFFKSLAQFGQTRAIGVVLSGNASDGAAGVRELRSAGGITMAQDPTTARFDGMPRAAIAAGVDFVLPPPLLAQELIRIATHPVVKRLMPIPVPATRTAGQEKLLKKVCRILREAGGVDFSNYKPPTIVRRLHRQMVLRKVRTLEEYVSLLEKDAGEVLTLSQSILIHVTRFFRDSDAFSELATTFVPKMMEDRAARDPVRVWVPGCSTGEEAYSVAITLLEQLGPPSPRVPILVFGTDVSEDAIDRARRGVFPESIAADVSPERLRKFFTGIDDGYRISQSVRDLCIFARQDVTQDPPFSKLDLIVCRNLLIYLDLAMQKRLLNVFYYALKPTGLLMLGAAESTGPQADLFNVADKKHRIYRKRAGKLAHHPAFAVGAAFPKADRRPEHLVESRGETRVQRDADRLLLDRFTPPAVLIDEDYQIRQIRGQVGPYLAVASGNASLQLFKMARPGLAGPLRSAIQRARQTVKPVRRTGLRVKTDSNYATVAIELIPIRTPDGPLHFLLLFENGAPERKQPRRTTGSQKKKPVSRRELERVRELEDELEGTRSELQSMIQDLEAANEELQSANEEIVSSNEELQSTNEELDTAREELQSTNEEIITVNEELHGRNEDLARVNSDLLNLLASVQLAIVMVDNDLRIRRFTPVAEKILNLMPGDVGRPIGHIKPNIDSPMLEAMMTEAIDTMTVQEREVRDFQGRRYSMKVRPYRNVDNRIDGAVVVFVDVESIRRDQDHHQRGEDDGLREK